MKKKKLISGLLFCASAFTVGLVGCGKEPAIDLCVPNNDYYLAPGEIVQIEAILTEIKKDDVAYIITTGPATVTQDGKLKVNQDARVGDTIIVTAKYGSVEKQLTLLVEDLKPTSISLTASNPYISLSSDVSFSVTYNPTYATVKDYSLSIIDGSDYAEIVNGKLLLKQSTYSESIINKKIKVRATLSQDATVYSDCEVTIADVKPTSIELSPNKSSIEIGDESDEVSFNVIYNPTYSTIKDYTLTVIDGSDYAKIVDGKLKLKSFVSTELVLNQKIKVRATLNKDNSIYDDCEISMTDNIPESIVLESNNSKIAIGGAVEFSVTYNPTYATVKDYSLSIIDGSDYAEIVNNELVLKAGINEDDAAGKTITVKATLVADENVSATCNVTIVKATEIYTILATNVNFNTAKDANKYLSVTAYNEAGDKVTTTLANYTFESSDENVVYVDENGKLFPRGHGEAIVEVKTLNGKITTQCKVFVMVPPTEFSLTNTFSNFIVANKVMSFSKVDALELDFEVRNSSYTRCTNKLDYEFELLNDDDEVVESGNTVATVSEGKISFLKTGRVKVTVKTNSSLNNVKTASYEKSFELIVNVNEGVNIDSIADFVAYAGQRTNKVANILCDLYLDAEHNFGSNGASYNTLYLYGDREIYGNGYVMSNERLPLIIAEGDNNNGDNMLEFAPVDTTTPFAVSIQDFELVGCGGVNAVYTGELSQFAGQLVVNTSNGKYIRTYRRGIVVSGNNYADGRAYAKSVNITNVKASGFDVALRINHAVNAYLSDVTISNCFSNGIESNQNIITMNNMTIGQVGAFAIELTPDDMKNKDTANPTGTAGVNYDQTAKCTMTGYIHCSNFNNGASTLYMQGLAAELGMSIPSMIEGITAGTIGAIKSAIPTADTSKMMEVAYECLQNTSGEINFYLLIFINTRDDFAAFKEEGNTLNRFAEYASDSSMGNMISMTEVLMHVAQDPTWTGYRDYNYIKFDLITGTTLGNIGQVIMINQAYNG